MKPFGKQLNNIFQNNTVDVTMNHAIIINDIRYLMKQSSLMLKKM